MTERYWGKYRGTVTNNIDPLQTGRIQVLVPDVLGLSPSTWAMPCVPIGGIQSGVFVMPAVGSGVWVEFEQGSIDHPIWVGGWWGSSSEVPSVASMATPGVPPIVLQTVGQHKLLMTDLPGGPGIMLSTPTGAMIMINEIGITIDNGRGASIVLAGPTVTVNQGALTVT